MTRTPNSGSETAPSLASGHVDLIGCGPGDPDLLTVKALKCLSAADVVVTDRLVPAEIVALAQPEARRIEVGKTPYQASISQDEINRILLREALQGHRVARLKGGDPGIFGRLAEELSVLRAAGVSVSVIPGVTAAHACAADIALPVTLRQVVRQFSVLTGATADSEVDLDWSALARDGQAFAIYMGVRGAEKLASRLLREGAPASRAVVIVENGTRPEQRTIKTTLGELAAAITHAAIQGPAIIFVGLDWAQANLTPPEDVELFVVRDETPAEGRVLEAAERPLHATQRTPKKNQHYALAPLHDDLEVEEKLVTAAPLLPKNAPFTAEDIQTLNGLVQRTTPLQRSWLSGFLAGLDASGQSAGAQTAASKGPKTPLTILYATESGNCETLALRAKKLAQKQNFDARVYDMADADLDLLAKSKNIVAYVATHGEGDPPERAADFYAAVMGDDAPRLEGVKFAVLALGDTSYVNFCQTGREFDERFEALGAERIAERADLDLDFKKQAASWTESTISVLAPEDAASPDTVVHVDFSGGFGLDEDGEPVFDEENPLEAEISDLINLNGSGSTQETWHVELAFEDPQFVYKPGDAIGVLPSNDPAVAEQILDSVGLSGDDALRDVLVDKHDITTLSRPVLTKYSEMIGNKKVAALAEPDALAKYTDDRQLMDLFAEYPEKLTKDQLLGLLRPLPGRLYSVASSLKAHPEEAHLLIGAVRWQAHGRVHGGVASTYFADRRKVGDTAKIYVKPNRHFAVPEDPDHAMIMIGAGTGVAPYRGFVEERMETGASGKNWLFFGERNYTDDFLYQLEWQDFIEDGILNRIDVAFSRDQPEKIYVQDRLWQAKDDVRRWIDDGAHIYVCGDEKHMAKDVDQTLVNILAEGTGGDEDKARAQLKELSKTGRYQRDVY